MTDPAPGSGDGTLVSEAQESLLHDYALEQVPTAKRRSLYETIVVWTGWSISLSAFLVGGVVGAGTTFGEGMSAILLGNAVLAVVGALVGIIGYRTGLTTYLLSRVVFGRFGSVLVSLVLGILAMGFIGVLMDAFGAAMSALVPITWTAVVLIFAVLITVTALFGFRGLAVLSSFAAPAMVLLALLGIWRVSTSEGGFAAVVAAVPAEPIPYEVAIGAVIATWITGAALSSDIARYARHQWHVVVGALCGYVLGAGLFEGAATITAMAVGNPNFVAYMSSLGLLLPAVLVVLLALWTTTDNNLYSSALAFTNASKLVGWAIAKPVWTIISVLIAIGAAFLGFAAVFLNWLLIIAIVTPPFAGILIAHFWVFRAIDRDPAAMVAELASVRWVAIIAWVAASTLNHFTDIWIKPLTGLILGAFFYVVGELLVRMTRQEPVEGVEPV